MDSREIAEKAYEILDSKKARDIKVLEISSLTIVADYFVIATGTSNTHIRSLEDEIEEKLHELGVEPRQIEGKSSGWILMDYYGVLIHIFTPEERKYYNLERLWADAKQIDFTKNSDTENKD
jgi:ribosome-associated protein